MKKILLCLFLAILCGCSKEKIVACSRFINDHQILLNIASDYDDIRQIDVMETLTLPYDLLISEEKMDFLYQQLDDSFHVEENMLVKQYQIIPEETYSLRKTLENLRERRYFCE